MKEIEIIHAIDPTLRKEAFAYFSEKIFEKYGNHPAPLEDKMNLLVIKSKGVIKATIGVYLVEQKELLPYEKLYNLTGVSAELLPERSKVAFISRWAASENKFGMLISYYAAKFIAKNKREIASCILKPQVARYLNTLSENSWFNLEEAKLMIGRVNANDLNFFTSGPRPQIYLSYIDQYIAVVEKDKNLTALQEITKVKF